jgi:hypothetical protein
MTKKAFRGRLAQPISLRPRAEAAMPIFRQLTATFLSDTAGNSHYEKRDVSNGSKCEILAVSISRPLYDPESLRISD